MGILRCAFLDLGPYSTLVLAQSSHDFEFLCVFFLIAAARRMKSVTHPFLNHSQLEAESKPQVRILYDGPS